MKNHKIIILLMISPFIVSNSWKLNKKSHILAENKWSESMSSGGPIATTPELSIADVQIVEGNTGQRSAEVMVCISQGSSSPVIVEYTTKNGTATEGSDYVAAKGMVNFAPGEMMKKIAVTVNGDLSAEADETFEIVLSNPSGASIKDDTGIVKIVNDDKGTGTNVNDIFKAGIPSVYEVRISYTGYILVYGTLSDCPIRRNGKVVMTGLLGGIENVTPDDDIRYTGYLQMDMDIDICDTKPKTGSEEDVDEHVYCGMTVVGSGPVNADLEIDRDGSGGWIKIEQSGVFTKSVSGSCLKKKMDDELTIVPNETIASIFNGRDLPMLKNRTLSVGRYATRGEGTEMAVEVLRIVKLF